MNANPFTPIFGKVPLHLAGRGQVIQDVTRALDSQGNDPALVTLLVGARGMGKTALLSALANSAEERGWVAARVTAAPGMLDEIILRLGRSAAHIVEQPPKRKLKGVGLSTLVSFEWENVETSTVNWRTKMDSLLDALAQTDTGLLVTVDEVVSDLDEMTTLVTTFQHFLGEGRKVALLMAGLPSELVALLSGKTTSFVRRAARYELGPIADAEIEESLRSTLADGGVRLSAAALNAAVRAIAGFPYMLQLVGYRIWNAADAEGTVTDADVESSIRIAQEELESRVYEATYYELTEADRAFLCAMLQDEGPTRQSDMAARLGKGTGHVSKYKKRLLQQGVIEERPKGVLRFCLPGFKDYFARQESQGESSR